MLAQVNENAQSTPKLFCAVFFHMVDGAYEMTSMHIAAMNGRQAKDIVNSHPDERFGPANCKRFIVTDEVMELHAVNTHTVECHDRRSVFSIEQLQQWIHSQTTDSVNGPAAFRSF